MSLQAHAAAMAGQVLTHQNQKLALQVESLRMENKQLQQKVEAQESQQQEYARTLLGVRRCWDEFNNDVRYLSSCVQPLGLEPEAAGARAATGSAELSRGPPLHDPYLSQLLASAEPALSSSVASAASQLTGDLSSVEQALLARSEASKQALTRLLQAVQQLQGQPSSTDAGLVAQLQRQRDADAAQRRLIAADCELAKDRWLEAQAKIKALEDELADSEQQLTSAQRKVVSLRSSLAEGAAAIPTGGGPAAASCSTPTPQPPQPAPRSLEPPAFQVADCLPDAAAEEGVATLLAKRNSELDAEREAHAKTNR